jgi:hypothetical protein
MLSSTIILEGRVTSVVPDGKPGFDRAPYRMTFEVTHSHRGTNSGDTVTATGYIPIPGVPIMCPQFPSDVKNLLGKYVIIGLAPNPERTGELLADAWNMSFIGDEPDGQAYELGRRIVEMTSDSNPEAPLLTLNPPLATCGQSIRFVGRRFPEGKYLLRYGFGRPIALLDVGPGGGFEAVATFNDESCRNSRSNAHNRGFHVVRLIERGSSLELDPVGATEVAAVPIAGAVDREQGSAILRATPNPAHCNETLAIEGAGFEPAERLSVSIVTQPDPVAVTADGEGSFALRLALPAELCGERLASVVAVPSGFESLVPPLSVAEAFVQLAPAPPAAPRLGTGPQRSQPHRDLRDPILLAGAIVLGVSAVAFASVRWARRVSSGRTRR